LAPHLLVAEIDRIMDDTVLRTKMAEMARRFARPNAARKIAEILVETALEHEPV
jgi:UDP-N-acetylglucosamine:LPS N-acetylglucosamine transferase